MSILTTEVVGEVFNGTFKWMGDGALASNGCIYFAPGDATRVLKHDTSTNISTLVGDDYGSDEGKWSGGVFTNNSVYFAPACSKKVLKVNINTDSTELVGLEYDGERKWSGGVLGEDGFVYFVPCCAEQILRLDPTNDTFELVGDKYKGEVKWMGGVVASNKNIYSIPYSSSQVMKFDPTTKVTQLIGDEIDGRCKYHGGTIGSDGCIYAAPMSANKILRINPNTDEVTQVGSNLPEEGKWSKFVQGNDKCLYGIPFNATKVLRYDVHAQTSSLVGPKLEGGFKWYGGVLGPDNCIYGSPFFNDKVLKLSFPPIKDPTMWAITYEQLLEVRDQAEEMSNENFNLKTMRDIVDMIIRPLCEENNTSYALSKNIEGLKTDVFVTHSWDELFGEFTNAIERTFRSKLVKPNLWICAFALNQAKDHETHLGTGETGLDQSPFVRALKGAASYLIVRNSKKDLCTRIWCIAEFIYAKEYGFIPTKTDIAGPNTFANSNSSVYHAEATVTKDRDKIMTVLLNKGSRHEIDDHMTQFRALCAF